MRIRSFISAFCLITLSLLSLAAEREGSSDRMSRLERSTSMRAGRCVRNVPPSPSQASSYAEWIASSRYRPTFLFAEYHVWHGLPSHSQAFSGAFWLPHQRAYDSRDPEVIARHIANAKKRGIDGFVVDWYGPPDGVANDDEREFMNDATLALISEAETQGFMIALLYDEGTVTRAGLSTDAYMARVIADLSYAESHYYSSPAYLRLRENPALFVFAYDDVEPYLDWSIVRGALSTQVTLIDKDPNPDDPAHDEDFDGFYAWVQPTGGAWDPDGNEWGEEYLQWFYSTMASTAYADKIAVGGVWPGFDDSLAPWGSMRFMSRQGRSVYYSTWRIAAQHGVPIVMIATWNDFEEGTDVECGVQMVVDMNAESPEILMRSSPLKVIWARARGAGVLQVYKDGTPIYDQSHSSGVYISLQSGQAYEIKVWVPGSPTPLAQTVKIRRQDPIPNVVPIVVD